MRTHVCKRKLSGVLLAAMAAGILTVPAPAAQSSSQSKTHKSSNTAKSGHATSSGNKSTNAKSSGKKKSKKVKGQAAPTTDRITEIQDALVKKGVMAGTPSGKLDDSTAEAVKKFQSTNGLNPTGKLDALTLQKLGLGSETAGLAAPTPPPNSINRLRNSTSSPVGSSDSNAEPR